MRDRIGLRTDMILWYNTMLRDLFYHSGQGVLMFGEEGQVFYGHQKYANHYHGLDYNLKEPAKLAAKLQALQDTLQQKGIDFLYINMPDKKTVYGEYFPKAIARPIYPTLNERLEEELSQTTVAHIFLKNTLIEARAKHNTYNRIVDPGHFNAYGAYYAHEAIAKALQKIYPDYPLLHEEDFSIEEEAIDLRHTVSMMGSETVLLLKLKNRNFAIQENPFANCNIASSNPHAPLKKNTADTW